MNARNDAVSGQNQPSNTSSQGMFSSSAKKPHPFIGAQLSDGTSLKWDNLEDFVADLSANNFAHAHEVNQRELDEMKDFTPRYGY